MDCIPAKNHILVLILFLSTRIIHYLDETSKSCTQMQTAVLGHGRKRSTLRVQVRRGKDVGVLQEPSSNIRIAGIHCSWNRNQRFAAQIFHLNTQKCVEANGQKSDLQMVGLSSYQVVCCDPAL